MTSLDGHTEVSWAVPEAQHPVEEAGLVQRNLAAFVMSSGLDWALLHSNVQTNPHVKSQGRKSPPLAD